MCLALIAIGQHPLYPLIILSNRDEFYSRSSAPADYWPEHPHMFSGKDLVKQGTWLGVNTNGHFALLTNYRDPKVFKPSLRSRGLLVSTYLSEWENKSPLEYIAQIKPSSSGYNTFNLIIGDPNHTYYYSNVKNETEALSAGTYCLSNHLLDTPWYKVVRAKTLFSNVLNEISVHHKPDNTLDLLFNILSDRTLAPEPLLPETGIPKELEKALSSIYVDVPEHQYGTCSSTVILFEKNTISFSEKIFKNGQMDSFRTSYITPLYALF